MKNLIELTALPHPDMNEGKSWPVFVDASRILNITRGRHQNLRLDRQRLKIEVYDDLFFGIQRLTRLLMDKMPTEIDNQEAAKWAKEMHAVSHDVQECYSVWGRAYRSEDFHPPTECTEIQLACGTALEHGVMLARIFVVEQPDEVVRRMAKL